MPKQALYKTFISRLESAYQDGRYFETSWYAYAVLEDRLRSLLRNSGGEGVGGSATPIKMMGPKLKELSKRALSDKLLKANYEHDRLDAWKDDRNNLMHAMAEATMTITQIDQAAKKLAKEGVELVREYAAACRRLKKHRSKVPI